MLLVFGESTKLRETFSLAEGGVRIENDPVQLEEEVIMQVKQRRDSTYRQEHQLHKYRMAQIAAR